LISSDEMINAAAGASMRACDFLDTEVTVMFIRDSKGRSVKSGSSEAWVGEGRDNK
jgi:hypothetical protein